MRVIRVLVYEGDPKVIDQTMRHNGVKGYYRVPVAGGLTIHESLIGYAYPLETETTTEEEPKC